HGSNRTREGDTVWWRTVPAWRDGPPPNRRKSSIFDPNHARAARPCLRLWDEASGVSGQRRTGVPKQTKMRYTSDTTSGENSARPILERRSWTRQNGALVRRLGVP